MRGPRHSSIVRGAVLLGALMLAALIVRPAAAAPCASGVFSFDLFPCTLDDKTISNFTAVASPPKLTTILTTITFDTSALDPGFTLLNTGGLLTAPPEVTATITFTLATNSGLPLIEDVSASLVGAAASPTASVDGRISTPGGDLLLTKNTTSGTVSFPPVASLSEVITLSLSPGIVVGGSASLEGLTIHFSEVPAAAPEPASGVLLVSGVVGVGGLVWRRRGRR